MKSREQDIRMLKSVVPVSDVLEFIEKDGFMGKRGASGFLGLSVSTIEKNLHEIPHFRFGTKVLFKRSELLHWMESKREKALNEKDSETLAGQKIADDLWKKLCRK